MIDNDKTLVAVDRLLDEVNQLRTERDEARKQAFEWRNVGLLDPGLTAEQFKTAVRMNPLPWEADL
jgi:hypothetical protein